MAVPQNFRNALNGFNKDDVVRYLEYINAKHNNQILQLTAEVDELRAQLNQSPMPDADQQALLDALQKENDSLSERLLESEKARSALVEELAQSKNAPVPVSEAPSVVSDELEAYRRAERTEREAKKRAELVYFQANSVLSETTTKVDVIAEDINGMVDKVANQLAQLQMLVGDSKQALQDAAALLSTIRPNT